MAIKWIVIAFCTLLVGNTLAESSSKSYSGGFSSSRSSKPTPSKPAAPQNTERRESKNTSFGTFGSSKKTDTQTTPSQSASNKSMSRAAEKDKALRTMNEREARARQSASNIYIPNTRPNQQAPDPYRQSNSERDTNRNGSFGQSMAGSVLGSMLGNSISRSNHQSGAAQNQQNQAPVEAKKPEQSSGWFGVFLFGLIVFIIAFLILAFFLRKKSSPRNYSLGDR
jgi:ATP-dependent Zn protease